MLVTGLGKTWPHKSLIAVGTSENITDKPKPIGKTYRNFQFFVSLDRTPVGFDLER